MPETNEAALVRAAVRGDEAAFAALMRAHRERVYRVARRMVGSHETAEDIAQLVFITMHAKLHTFRGRSKLSTWLYRIAMNACYDQLRRERPAAELDFDRVPASDPRPDAHAVSNETVARIHALIQTLPPKQRMTVTLRLCEGLAFKEVAQAMDCTVGTAKVNYFHAIRRLRDALEAEGVAEYVV